MSFRKQMFLFTFIRYVNKIREMFIYSSKLLLNYDYWLFAVELLPLKTKTETWFYHQCVGVESFQLDIAWGKSALYIMQTLKKIVHTNTTILILSSMWTRHSGVYFTPEIPAGIIAETTKRRFIMHALGNAGWKFCILKYKNTLQNTRELQDILCNYYYFIDLYYLFVNLYIYVFIYLFIHSFI